MSTAPKDCKRARRQMARAFDASLPVEACLELEAHAAGCARCGPEWARTRALLEALRDLPEAPPGGLDLEAAASAVNARIDALPAQAERAGARWRWVASAAGVLLAAGAWQFLGDSVEGEPSAASGAALGQAALALEGSQPEVAAGNAAEDGPPERLQPEAEPPGAPEYDAVLRNAVLAQVEARLVEALDEYDPAGLRAGWAEDFRLSNADLVARGWPLDGLLRSLVDGNGEPRLRAAALRACGPIGGRALVPLCERVLGDADLGPAAAQALVELGPVGELVLARAWWRPELRDALQERLLGEHADRRRALVPHLLRTAPRAGASHGESAALAALLVDGGEPGMRELVLLLGRDELDPEAVLAAIGRADAGRIGAVLAELMDEFPAQLREPELLAAAGASGAPVLQGWVLERAERGRYREEVAGALARFGSIDALDGLVRLEASRRVDPEAFLGAFALAAQRAPEELEALALRYLGDSQLDLARRLLRLCAAAGNRESLDAGLRLCASGMLPEGERRDGLLGLAEVMEPGDSGALAELFARLEAGDGSIAATALLVGADLGGEPATAALLDSLGSALASSRRRRVAERLERTRGSRWNALYTLSTLLEPCLEARGSVAPSNLENL